MRGGFARAVLVACACGLLSPANTGAQARSLHWKALAVEARLDADGALHVRERHHILFSGDWNGGERKFDVPFGQLFELRGVTRIDPATGKEQTLARGDLSRVDQYDESEGSESVTVRWRSRLPSDPPFDRTPIVYVLDYVLHGVLGREGDSYFLDHDFAFERPGPIDELTVALAIDPAWRVHGSIPELFRAENLGSGEAFVVRAELSGDPPIDRRRSALQLVLIAAPVLLVLAFVWRERKRGRFAPLPAVPIADPQWLAEHLFRHPPELVAVLWNRSSPGAHAVAALLARLELDGKLRTRLANGELQMELLVDRAELGGYEREFVDGFFFAGNTTSTSAVRAHYKKTGFNPAQCMSGPLRERMRALIGPFGTWWAPLWLPLLMLVGGALCLLAPPGAGVLRVVVALLPGIWIGVAGGLLAWWWRRRLDFGLPHMLPFLAVALIPACIAFVLLESGTSGWSFAALLGVVLVALGYFVLVLGFARANEPRAGLALRRRLTACRLQLQDELARPREFNESIVPYVFAFGLGKAASEWFVRAPNASARTHTTLGSQGVSASASASGDGSAARPFSGGGGGFSGAGASGAWVSAVSAMSRGVAAPSSSSSSSGGGGGGGSRSGGGSGGGW